MAAAMAVGGGGDVHDGSDGESADDGPAAGEFAFPTYAIVDGTFAGQTIGHPYFDEDPEAGFEKPSAAQKKARKELYKAKLEAWTAAHSAAGGPKVVYESNGKPVVKPAATAPSQRLKPKDEERITALRFLALAWRWNRDPPTKRDDDYSTYCKYKTSGSDNLDWQSVSLAPVLCDSSRPLTRFPSTPLRILPTTCRLQMAQKMLVDSLDASTRATVERLNWRDNKKWALFTAWCRQKVQKMLSPDKETGNGSKKKMDSTLSDLLQQAYGDLTSIRIKPMGEGSGLPSA